MKNARTYGKPSPTRYRGTPPRGAGYKNEVTVVGRLVADPEFLRTSTGVFMTRFRVAAKVPGGKAFYSVVAWARLGQLVARQFSKGQLIRVDGSTRRRSWESKTGDIRQATQVVADWCYSVPRDRSA
jgi:single-stranded DNA-binding protein